MQGEVSRHEIMMLIENTAIIATVFNEEASMERWLDSIAFQSAWPEEFVIVDGGSSDRTVVLITKYAWPLGFPVPKVIVKKCNIAEGRNLAIRNCRAEISSFHRCRISSRSRMVLSYHKGVD